GVDDLDARRADRQGGGDDSELGAGRAATDRSWHAANEDLATGLEAGPKESDQGAAGRRARAGQNTAYYRGRNRHHRHRGGGWQGEEGAGQQRLLTVGFENLDVGQAYWQGGDNDSQHRVGRAAAEAGQNAAEIYLATGLEVAP